MSTRHTLADLLTYRHAILREGDCLPHGAPDILLWAATGIFIRGTDPAIDVLLRIAETPPLPGLAHLAPGVTWTGWGGPLPAELLDEALAAAWAACRAADGRWRPCEWQGYVVLDPGPRLITPVPTPASAVRVEAPRPSGLQIAVDIHSHQYVRASRRRCTGSQPGERPQGHDARLYHVCSQPAWLSSVVGLAGSTSARMRGRHDNGSRT